MKETKKYQIKAIKKLLSRTDDLFDEKVDNATIVFQAPTGSGKTFMMTRFLEEMIKKDSNMCFLWVSIGKGELHKQSFKSVKNEISYFTKCHLLENEFFGSRSSINRNDIVFVNWEKIRSKDNATGEWKNNLMKDKETYNFIEILDNTRRLGRQIITIIDESHSNSNSERAIELRDSIIKPDLTIEMSATPVFDANEYNERVRVNPQDVIDEGMIKKEVIINCDIDQINDDEATSQEVIMSAAFNKRIELKNEYEKLGLSINPLVLIQLPNSERGTEKQDFVESFLSSKGITTGNGKLAIWLSEEKINQERSNLSKLDSSVEFLLFKQAIDTGWDCPRAQVLVKFREVRSYVFEVQTLGRILRMPEAKHYLKDILNTAYVYTNLSSIIVKHEEYNPNIIKSLISRRTDKYSETVLKSYYKNRRDYGDITSTFYPVFEKEVMNRYKLKKGDFDYNKNMLEKFNYNFTDSKKLDSLMINETVSSYIVDTEKDSKIIGETIHTKFSTNDLNNAFEDIIISNLGGFAPKRSVSPVKMSIYRFFKDYLNITANSEGLVDIQKVCVENKDELSILLDTSVEKYKPVKEKSLAKKNNGVWRDDWEIEESRSYNPKTNREVISTLSLYQPLYFELIKGNVNQLEKDFIEFIDEQQEVIDWFWKNGSEHMEKNFGIKNGDKTFQPDFIIRFKDGRIGIFDTKASGNREDDNKEKSNALQSYIELENTRSKNLIGGLVIKKSDHFRVFSLKEYVPYEEDPDKWEYFKDYINTDHRTL